MGLGNPGPSYIHTRHNLGFQVLDSLAAQEKTFWRSWKNQARVAEIGGIQLLKPLRYMNRSGEVLQSFLETHPQDPSRLLVLYDDLDLPLGTLRLRRSGSSGGHHGMDSVLNRLRTQEVPRLRLGIGPAPDQRDPIEFVLEPFAKTEEAKAQEMRCRAVQCIQTLLTGDWERAMNLYNTQNLPS